MATNLWKSYEKLLYGNGNKIHYKKFDSLFSIEGKSNKTGIRFLYKNLTWLGLEIPVVINKNKQYEQEALRNPVSYCRIIRKFVRSRYKYYLQNKTPYWERASRFRYWNSNTCYFKRKIGEDFRISR